jgi:hypothetical protein
MRVTVFFVQRGIKEQDENEKISPNGRKGRGEMKRVLLDVTRTKRSRERCYLQSDGEEEVADRIGG